MKPTTVKALVVASCLASFAILANAQTDRPIEGAKGVGVDTPGGPAGADPAGKPLNGPTPSAPDKTTSGSPVTRGAKGVGVDTPSGPAGADLVDKPMNASPSATPTPR